MPPRQLTQYEAEFVCRFLNHTHAAYALVSKQDLEKNPQYAGALLGLPALAIVYAYDAVFSNLSGGGAILAEIANAAADLNITLNSPLGPGHNSKITGQAETPDEQILRHLRNCFAHFRFVSTVDANQDTFLVMEDYNRSGVKTFAAKCEVFHVVDLGEKILIAAHKVAVDNAVALGANVTP